MLAIEANALAKNYAGEKALQGISFQVPQGSLFGIIGADGAGKSTLLSILTTLIDSDTGSAQVLNYSVQNNIRAIRQEIGYMPQKFSLYQDLSVLENLEFFSDIFSVPQQEKQKRIDELLRFADLVPFKARKAGQLSGGMKQKLALSCTLVHQPNLLLLDEPTVGVDPVARRDFWRMLKMLKVQGKTILVSTPYMDEAELCEDLIILHHGKILAHGTPQNLMSQYPFQLLKAEGSKTLFYSQTENTPEPIEIIYPVGGALHIGIRKNNQNDNLEKRTSSEASFSKNKILSLVQTLVPEITSLQITSPNVEDVFIALLAGKMQWQSSQGIA